MGKCCILPLDLNKEQVTHTHTYNLIFLFFNGDACGEQESSQRECVQRSCWESKQPVGSDFSQNSRTYIVLKLPCDSHSHNSSPCNTCFPLAMVYTYTMLVLDLSWLIPMHFFIPQVHAHALLVFPAVTLLILSTIRCIYQVHLPGSLLVKAIYYQST